MTDTTNAHPARARRFDRAWLMRQTTAWADGARLALAPRRRYALRPVPLRPVRRPSGGRVPAL